MFLQDKPYTVCLLVLLLVTSCIPSKRLLYLQDHKADVDLKYDVRAPKSLKVKDFEYHLRPDDRISVKVFSLTQEKFNFFGSPELELLVDKGGSVELPVIGALKVGGLTLVETGQLIESKTTDYLKNPFVTVRLLNFTFTVLGEVVHQGNYINAEPKLTILEAIGKAGGMTDFADRSLVRIIRHEKGTAQIFYVNVQEDNLILSDNYYIRPNDVIVVNPIKAKTTKQYQMPNISLAVSILSALGVLFVLIRNQR